MRRAALVTLLCFGCATARQPSTFPLPHAGAPPQRVALAEPELELWMEGTRRVDPDEAARALEESREALAKAVEGRGLDGVESPDALLAIRSRAVARTSERRNAQIASAVGIVAVVAVAVAAFVAGRSHSRSQRTTSAAAPFRAGGAGVARAAPWRLRPAAYYPSPFFWGWAVGVHVAVPPPRPPPRAVVPAHDPLLDVRGWFDGDEVELVAELVEPKSGEVRWRKVVREGVDPRDAAAMTRLVDRALAGESFGQRTSSRQPPGGPAPRRPEPAETTPPAPPGPRPTPEFDADLDG